MACYQELAGRLYEEGYCCYRLGIQSMSPMSGDSGYNRLLLSIKRSVDPANILAPGRYQPE
jgi:4-cresol dehydrogenase (hydroxylating)